ncbi:MAG: glutamine--fructose-6-phosphate transaminase (isomerizing) [Bacteroidetes bacterium]|nr:glutamine--fructose-6-phosphate transaminase (isomerizing) [Bacteroidota bacterium]
MCGIVAYIGHRQAKPILIKGLQRLEYRGYDSAGIALISEETAALNVYKIAGKVNDLNDFCEGKDVTGHVGMGHTRWATHGEPSDVNAHPHTSADGTLSVIHNGIIENHEVLKKELINRGYEFVSQTDTEVLVHLIHDIQKKENVNLEEAVRLALCEVIGAYAIVVMSSKEPNVLIGARKSSPMVIGVGEGEHFIASDATPIVEYTRNVIYLEDNEVATIRDGELTIKTIDNEVANHYIQELEINLETLEKGGFEHFMLKEIYSQPESITDCLRGRIRVKDGIVQLGGLSRFENSFENIKRIIIVACGTSWHAGLVGEYLIEELARIPVEVEYASEFRYRNPIILDGDLVIAISQSGETADTLAALQMAKEKGAIIWGVCNVVGSSIPRITDAGVYTHAGPEIGVASTKAFTAQVTVLTMIALRIAFKRGKISQERLNEVLVELENIPDKIRELLKSDGLIKEIAEIYKDAPNCLYLGRGYQFPVALEGALKLKEISYIHAEGYPAAEMKHGPIALIDESMPVVVIASNKLHYEKVVSNVQEVKARKGKIIAVVTKGDTSISALADHLIEIPETDEVLTPLLSVVPLQLLAYHIAVMRGCNVDQPRNLAKSVTVE